jgi:hypothetical protein
MLTQQRLARSLWVNVPWVIIVLLVSCGEQHGPRAAPIIARQLGGDSLAPGAMVRICKPEDEACVPTYPVACSTTWAGDAAQKPNIPSLSPQEQAWCAAQASTDSSVR